MLASVVAADGRRDGAAGVGDSQGVREAVTQVDTRQVRVGIRRVRIGCGARQNHRFEVNSEFADVRTAPALEVSKCPIVLSANIFLNT